jgi:indole-3-glycerol phosphate synthase
VSTTGELERIVGSTRAELERRRQEVPLEQLQARTGQSRANGEAFLQAIRSPGLSLIAEHKRSSPSAGVIRADTQLAEVVRAYERGGAVALSILTEPTRFGGSLADIQEARRAMALPILRKDFIVERYQLYEALAAGADAVLLIVAALLDDELSALHSQASDLGLAALVEVHGETELERALACGAQLIGINNRDLSSLEVDPELTFALLPKLPRRTLVVAESGFSRRSQLDRLREAGVDAVLIGEALMRSPDIEAATRALTAPETRA